jgi:hypothetical protein
MNVIRQIKRFRKLTKIFQNASKVQKSSLRDSKRQLTNEIQNEKNIFPKIIIRQKILAKTCCGDNKIYCKLDFQLFCTFSINCHFQFLADLNFNNLFPLHFNVGCCIERTSSIMKNSKSLKMSHSANLAKVCFLTRVNLNHFLMRES